MAAENSVALVRSARAWLHTTVQQTWQSHLAHGQVTFDERAELYYRLDARTRHVLLDEVIAGLCPREGEIHVDGTFGAGGYTKAILDGSRARVYAIDRDPDALATAREVGMGLPSGEMIREHLLQAIQGGRAGEDWVALARATGSEGSRRCRVDEMERLLDRAATAFARTGFAGTSMVDVAAEVRSQNEDVEFIAQEIYVDNDIDKGFRPQVGAWRLPTEPWTFVIGADGKVVERFEGAVSVRGYPDGGYRGSEPRHSLCRTNT